LPTGGCNRPSPDQLASLRDRPLLVELRPSRAALPSSGSTVRALGQKPPSRLISAWPLEACLWCRSPAG
jgi:hypothetical protein